ncbi:MAG: hypothetical protein DRI61_13615, partial [Chloroflexi bacterium]
MKWMRSKNGRAISLCVLVALVVALALGLAYFGYRLSHIPLLSPAQQEWLSRKGKLIIAGDKYLPPFEYIEGNEYKGFNVDLMYSLSLHLGTELELRPMAWDEARRALERGEVDAIQGMRYTPERARIYDFTRPFLQSYSVIFVPVEQEGVDELEDLKGLRVAVQEGDIAHDFLKAMEGIQLITAPTQAEGFQLLLEGKADAFVGNKWTGLYNLKRLGATGAVKAVGDPLFPSPYCMAVKKGNKELLEILNRALAALQKDGAYSLIYEK